MKTLKWKSSIEPLLVQGEFWKILHLKETDLKLKGIRYHLSSDVWTFAINACADSLPFFKNILYSWGNDCLINVATVESLEHCITYFIIAPTCWTDISGTTIVIANITKTLMENDSYHKKHRNICWCRYNTIPPTVLITQQKPDICMVNSQRRIILLMELTVSFKTNIDKAHNTKEDRYASLISDLKEQLIFLPGVCLICELWP